MKGLVGAGTMLVNVPVMAGADCNVNPAVLVHVKMILDPERLIVSRGALTVPNVRLNTVPLPELPPPNTAPYRVLPDKSNSDWGLLPSFGAPIK